MVRPQQVLSGHRHVDIARQRRGVALHDDSQRQDHLSRDDATMPDDRLASVAALVPRESLSLPCASPCSALSAVRFVAHDGIRYAALDRGKRRPIRGGHAGVPTTA